LPFSYSRLQKRAIGKSKGNCGGFPYKKEEIINNFQTPFVLKKWSIFGDFWPPLNLPPRRRLATHNPRSSRG